MKVNRKPNKICLKCGTHFYEWPSRPKKFCSRKCSAEEKNELRLSKAESCKTCGKLVIQRHAKSFCSLSCSAIHYNSLKPKPTEEVLLERKLKLQEYKRKWKTKNRKTTRAFKTKKYPHSVVKPCMSCGVYRNHSFRKKYCENCYPNIEHYRSLAQFVFNVYAYPSEFDLELVNKIGWYSPTGRCGKNKDNLNLNGASRDHLFTILDGFNQKVHPSLLAHPANCRIVSHRDNSKKNCNSSITLEELALRISAWDNKYGEYSYRGSVKPLLK